GRFEIVRILSLEREENELLRIAAAAESGSDHVLARVIVEEARRRSLRLPEGQDARVLPGRGAECELNGRTLRAGNAAFLAENGVHNAAGLLDEADRLGATAVLIAENDRLLGGIFLRDRVRAGVKDAIAELKDLEITHVVMLTGD